MYRNTIQLVLNAKEIHQESFDIRVQDNDVNVKNSPVDYMYI